MSFCDITIAQRNANFTNITDTSAQLVSLNSDGSAVLKIGTETAQFIVQNLSQANAKQVLISTGSVEHQNAAMFGYKIKPLYE